LAVVAVADLKEMKVLVELAALTVWELYMQAAAAMVVLGAMLMVAAAVQAAVVQADIREMAALAVPVTAEMV
jgi:hypothetical protein